MKSFLREVIEYADRQEEQKISDLIFILPSKRAGLFLKKELANYYKKQTLFAPNIISIEDFIAELSDLQLIDNTETLFEFYEAYLGVNMSQPKEDFETFSSWAQTLIYDFNEIDRYCIDHHSFFSYLSSIQDINHWYVQKEKTALIENYIIFWNNLYLYYQAFSEKLIQKKAGYQGLLYREAANKVEEYASNSTQKHFFVGFNALNNAEQQIFQVLLEKEKAEVFWDVDKIFIEDKNHDASLFVRDYLKHWNHYKKQPFKPTETQFALAKKIDIIGVPKNIGQAKYVGEILTLVPKDKLENTAVVLADEKLLLPMLNSFPKSVDAVNITMGLSLKDVPMAAFFELLFKLHKLPNEQGIYYKAILEVLNTQIATRILGELAQYIANEITKDNLIYISAAHLFSFTKNKQELNRLKLLFESWSNATIALERCHKIVYVLKECLDKEKHVLELEYAFRFHTVFNNLERLNTKFKYIESLSSLYRLYQEIITVDTLDFKGEPLRGLQLMGMLESRCLDFETVIITSVNEGILPAGKSANSFIPYDLKRTYKLPTYKEKDAIYTYHFYHLLQRAKQVYLLYNTEAEGVSAGEKSRFLLQLEINKQAQHEISHKVVATPVPRIQKTSITIQKNDQVLEKLRSLMSYGLSPSAITSYIRNPIEFYYRYILGIKESEVVEETIAANTMGTVIHNTLENFYKPFVGKNLELVDIKKMYKQIDKEVTQQFKEEYSSLDIKQGKNLLIYEVSKRYVYNFLKLEEDSLKQGKTLRIVAIESDLKAQIDIPELPFPVYIKGKVDRIDELDGQLRIIDYKTGKVMQGDVEVVDWDVITTDYKYSKIIQVLAYSYMQYKEKAFEMPAEAGIISFKNLKGGFLKFGTKASKMARKKDNAITTEVLEEYLKVLKALIIEIYDHNQPFIEKEV
ncbi:PD-(D/E)XK nuclease family protein [Aquimarina rhabdastrellae]